MAPFGSPLNTAYEFSQARKSSLDKVTYYTAAAPNTVHTGALVNGTVYICRIRGNWDFPLPFNMFSPVGGPGIVGSGSVVVDLTFNQRWLDCIKFRNNTVLDTYADGDLTVSFTSPPSLTYCIHHLYDAVCESSMSKTQVYPMSNYINRRDAVTLLEAGASKDIFTSSTSVNTIPKKIIISAPRVAVSGDTNMQRMPTGNSYAPISGLTVSLGGQNVFSSLDSASLWRLSAKNGSSQTLSSFLNGGSVILSLEDGDLGAMGLSVGAKSDMELSAKFTITNTEAATYSYEPSKCCVTTEYLCVNAGSAEVSVIVGNNLGESESKTLMGKLREFVVHTPMRLGAGFGSWMSGAAKKVLGAMPQIIDTIGKGVGLVRTLRGGSESAGFIPQSNVTGGALKPKRGGGSLDEEPVRSRIL